MKKKFGAIVMAGIMACAVTAGFAFSGCGGKRYAAVEELTADSFDPNKKVEIKFYHTMGQDLRAVLTDYIEQFNILYPNIKVNEQQVGSYDDVRNKIVNEINADAGKYPNLAYCYPDHVAKFNTSGVVQPLNIFLPDSEFKDIKVKRADGSEEYLCLTEAQKNDYIEGYYNEGFQFGDGSTMYTLPFSKSTEVLYYNKTFFEDNNLEVPKSWDEMEEVLYAIKKIDPQSVPLGYDSEANWFITMCEQQQSGYTQAEGDKYIFDNEDNRAFVARFKKWFDDKLVITAGTYGVGGDDKYTSNLFKVQESYMCIGSSAGAKNQMPARVDGKYPFEIGITSIPQVHPEDKTKHKVISQGPSVCIFNHDTQEVIASWLFAKYLTTTVGFQARFSSVSGYVPVINSVMDNPTYKANIESANGYGNVTYLSAKVCLEQSYAYFTSPAFVGSSEAREQVGALLKDVFNDARKIPDAFKYAVEECKYRG